MTERRKDDRFYVRVDIGFWDHPKALAAGPQAVSPAPRIQAIRDELANGA